MQNVKLDMNAVRIKISNGVYVVPCKARNEFFRIEKANNSQWEIFNHSTNDSLGTINGSMQKVTCILMENLFTLEEAQG